MPANPQREGAIFRAAAQLTGAARASFLQAACHGAPALRQRLEALLAAREQSEGVLAETPPDAQATLEIGLKEKAADEAAGATIGRYKILEKVGEGGCGVVYVAEQTEPVRRRVALKVIKLGMDTKQVVARFEAERQALAMMDHPNIAKVLDAGTTETGRPYFIMELVRGIKITDYCDQSNLPTKERLDLFIKVCQAIQHAHQKGIIHRDIKPSNILVTLHDGVPVPKVIDFGIAKATEGRLTDSTVYTQLHQFMGTPAYMSPEQAEMSGLDIDTRSDIYSLGVLLYELLTGKTPFDAQELMSQGIDAMRRTIREKDPVRPSTKLATLQGEELTITAKRLQLDVPKLIHLLRGDLDWIVMKCLEKDRTRRYETANGLAMDIQRHLDNEPVVARPPSAAYRLKKAWKRNKVTYTAAAAVAVALVVGIGVSMWQTRRALRAEREQSRLREVAVKALDGEKEQRGRAETESQRAQEREAEARYRAYASDMNIAKQALDDNNLGHALVMLEKYVPKPGETDLRGWEWRYLWSQTRSDALCTLCQESNEIRSLSVSSDGNWIAVTVHGRGGLSLWSASERREVLRLADTEQNVCAVISPAEPLLAFSGVSYDHNGKQKSSLRLLNLVTRQMISDEIPLDGECLDLAISKDGGTLVTVTTGNRTKYDYRGHITLWGLPDGTSRKSYPLGGPGGFAVTPDLNLAAVSLNGVRVFELKTGRELWSAKSGASAMTFSPDSKLLAAEHGDDILLWDAATGQDAGRLPGHRSRVMSLLFWPDGKKLASASADQTIRIWDVPTQKCVNTLRGHRQQVWELALMPDHRTLVSGCRDGTVCLWNTLVKHPRQPRIEFPDVLVWAFETDSKSIVTLNTNGSVTRRKGANFEVTEPLLEIGGAAVQSTFASRCFSRDGRRLALGSKEKGVVQVWDIPNRTLLPQSRNYTGQPRAFFAGGKRLLTLSLDDFFAHDWDVTTGSEIQSWRIPADIIHYALSPDERWCVIMGYSGDVVLRNLVDQSTSKLNLDIRESHDGNYSPDGGLLAVPSSLGFVRIWNTTTWAVGETLSGFSDEVYGSAFLPDGRRLAVLAGNREAVRLYDTSSWLDTLTLEGEGGYLWPTTISPDGNVIGATPVGGGLLQLWRAPSWSEIEEAEKKGVSKWP